MKDVGDSEKNKRFIRIFLPFLLMVLGFGLFSLLADQNDITEQPPLISSESRASADSPTIENTVEPVQDNITPTPKPHDGPSDIEITNTPISSNFTPDDIEIKGPPAESVFNIDSEITLYWTWSINEIEENFQFSVYLINELDEKLIGTKNEPSLGDYGYHFNFTPDEIVNSSGNYQIEIRLEQIDPLLVALRSNPVPILLE